MFWFDTEIIQSTVDVLNPLPNQLLSIKNNNIQQNVLVRERINCWDESLIPTTTTPENRRIPIRTLNLLNKPQNMGIEADFHDTISGTNDVGIKSNPFPLNYLYCTQGCPDINYSKLHIIFIILIVIAIALCCLWCAVCGGIRYYTEDDEFYTGRLDVERKKLERILKRK